MNVSWTHYDPEFDAVIECEVIVDHVTTNRPDFFADNPGDFFGYTEIEWHVELDGIPCPMLDVRLDVHGVEDKIMRAMDTD